MSGDRRPLSDVAYIGSNSKTKRPRKTKLCTGVPQVTCDSHTDFKVTRSMDKATIFKFGTHIGRGQFLPPDHKLARNWPTVSRGGGILWRPSSRTACYHCNDLA